MYTTSKHAKQNKKNSTCEFIYVTYITILLTKLISTSSSQKRSFIIPALLMTISRLPNTDTVVWNDSESNTIEVFFNVNFPVLLALSYFHDSPTVTMRTYLHTVDNP